MTSLLSIAAESAKNNSYYWLLAATLPLLLYKVTRKRKLNFFQRLFLKFMLKRDHKKNSKSEWGSFFTKVLICLGIFGLLLLFLDFGIAAALMLLIGLIVMNV
jgi:hypothetical protein